MLFLNIPCVSFFWGQLDLVAVEMALMAVVMTQDVIGCLTVFEPCLQIC